MDKFFDLPLIDTAELIDGSDDFMLIYSGKKGPCRIQASQIAMAASRQKRDLMLSPNNYNIMSARLNGTVNPGNAVGGSHRDFHGTFILEDDFDAVQLIVLSAETASNIAGATAAFAPSANYATPQTPTGSWTTFTWSGAGTFTMPTAPGTNLFAALASDWMPVQSLARDDSPVLNKPIGMLRFHFPSASGNYTADATTLAYIGSFNNDTTFKYRRWLRFTQAGVDGITTPSSFTANTDSNLFPSCILRFRTRGRVLSLMCSGDSITGGSFTTSYVMNYGIRAAQNESAAAFPVSYAANGFASRTSTTYLANAKTLITACQPQVGVYQVYSPNDGALTQSISDAQIQRAMEFVAHARANNTLPILMTATPINTDSLTVSNLKIAQTAKLLALQAKGLLVADVFNAVTDFSQFNGSGGYGWKAGLFGDATHMNDDGAVAMNEVLRPLLRQIVAANT